MNGILGTGILLTLECFLSPSSAYLSMKMFIIKGKIHEKRATMKESMMPFLLGSRLRAQFDY